MAAGHLLSLRRILLLALARWTMYLALGFGVYIIYCALVFNTPYRVAEQGSKQPSAKVPKYEYKVIYICTRSIGPQKLQRGPALGDRKDAKRLRTTVRYPTRVSLEYEDLGDGHVSSQQLEYEECPRLHGSQIRRYSAWTEVRDYELDCIQYVSHCNDYSDQQSTDFSVYPYRRGHWEVGDSHAEQ